MEEVMNLIELSELLLDEKKAEQYLLNVGILKTFTSCEKCGSKKLGRIRRGRYKCYSCKTEWSARKGSIIFYNNLSYSKFLAIIKMFELNIDATVAAKQLALNRNTINTIYSVFRKIILKSADNVHSNYFNFIDENNPAFGITITDGKVNIELEDKNKLPESLFRLIRTRNSKNNITFYFDYKRIKRLLHNDKLEKFPTEADHYFRYMKESLLKYRGTKNSYLFLYLKEIEFKYNNRNSANLFGKIVEKIAIFEGWLDSNLVSKNRNNL